jgi:hypothetical protein
MKKVLIGILIVALIGVIIGVVVMDFSSNKLDQIPKSKYLLNIDSIKGSGGYPVNYEEFKQFAFDADKLAALDVNQGLIYVAYDSIVKCINRDGDEQSTYFTDGDVKSVKCITDNRLIVLYRNYFSIYDSLGNVVFQEAKQALKSVYTSAAYNDEFIFIADAGNRRVKKYDLNGTFISDFEGIYNSTNDKKGFIIPSPYFDLAINQEDELWVVNPGRHAIQHYSSNGDLVNYWEQIGNHIEGFTGCCNPSHLAIFDDGRFVTAEKGIVRIKVYSKSGELESVVALPKDFEDKAKAPDIAVFGDWIYALDYNSNKLRLFRPKYHE